jgi:hypothetical protein
MRKRHAQPGFIQAMSGSRFFFTSGYEEREGGKSMWTRTATANTGDNESGNSGKITWRTYLLPALIGAILFEIINYVLEPDTYFASPSKAVFSFVLGAAVGWMYEVIRQQSELVAESMSQLNIVSKAFEYQLEALTMFLKDRRHGEVLTALLSASIRGHHIAYVNETQYLSYLSQAIEHSTKFQGVQRNPVRWFRDQANYLNVLREQPMKSKIRLFIIDDALAEQMEQDLNDAEVMNFYWLNTGIEVKTFWIQSSAFKHNFPQVAIPEDCAIFDEQLLIKYDDQHQILTFDVLQDNNNELEIFRQLQDQMNLKVPGPFIPIQPPSLIKPPPFIKQD